MAGVREEIDGPARLMVSYPGMPRSGTTTGGTMSRTRLSLRTLRKLYTDGQALLQARQYDAAIDAFRQVAAAGLGAGGTAEIAASPPPRRGKSRAGASSLYVKASLGLSFCCVEQGKLDEAISTLQAIMCIEPD